MRRAFLLLSIFVISLALVSCGGNSAVNGNGANANGVQLRSFADITDPAAALAEGNKLLDENDTENAIEAYKRAVELDPDLGEAYFKMGVAYSLLEAEAKHSERASVFRATRSPRKKQRRRRIP